MAGGAARSTNAWQFGSIVEIFAVKMMTIFRPNTCK
jgi:hypothetical protein